MYQKALQLMATVAYITAFSVMVTGIEEQSSQ